MAFSLKRIKRPELGLLSMHPFVDVLEGRNLFTATAHDGLLDIRQYVDGPTSDQTQSPWSNTTIGDAADVEADPSAELASRTTPHQVTLNPATVDGAFSDAAIDDTPWALFGNALHDRRGHYEPRPIPDDHEIASARESTSDDAQVFAAGRSMTGAMAPFLVMKASQANHPFA